MYVLPEFPVQKKNIYKKNPPHSFKENIFFSQFSHFKLTLSLPHCLSTSWFATAVFGQQTACSMCVPLRSRSLHSLSAALPGLVPFRIGCG